MLAMFRNLVLALEVWAIASVRAETGNVPQPPYQIVIVSRTDNMVCFECRETATQIKFNSWVLYRNGAPENNTDPCISAGNYSNGLLMISSECDGLYSCGVQHTSITYPGITGPVLTKPLPVYATPIPIETAMQSVNACVGETVFLPSFMPVSPLGNNEVNWFRVQNSGMAVTAKNGIVTANYSYNLVSVSTLDTGTYFAEVTIPDGSSVNGPLIVLTVTEKPGIGLIEVVDGLITVTVTPHDAEFDYEWRFNGIISEENGQTFSLSSTVDEDDQIELTISSHCGAFVTATIYILTNSTASPEVENSSVCFEKSHFIAIIVFFIIYMTSTILILLLCVCYCVRKRTRKQDTSNKKDGNNSQHPSNLYPTYPTNQEQQPGNPNRLTEVDHQISLESDTQYGEKFDCFTNDFRNLIMSKLNEKGLKFDDPYKMCLQQLYLLTLFLEAKKKLPKKFHLFPLDLETEAPQVEESFPGMDDLPEPLRAIAYYYRKQLSISQEENSNVYVNDYSFMLMESVDNIGEESDQKQQSTKM